MARDLAITYASVTLGAGADSAYMLEGPYTFSVDQRTARGFLRCQVTIQHDTESTYVTKEQALYAAWTTPDADLAVVLGATTRHTYTRSAGTGFNHRPTARKLGTEDVDSRRSARWELTVEWDLPADLYSASGRRNGRTTIELDAADVRTVTLAGEWTRTSTNSARTQFDAQVATYASTALAAIDGTATWELLPARSENDHLDNLLTFTRVYREVLDSSGSGTANLRDEQLVVSVMEEGPGDSVPSGASVARMILVSVAYSGAVPRASGTGTAFLRTVWLNQVRDYMLTRAAAAAGSPVVAVVEQEPKYDVTGNRVQATMRIMVDSGASFYMLRVQTQDDIDPGTIAEPVLNGNPWARDLQPGPGSWTRTVTVTALQPSGAATGLDALFPANMAGFFLRRHVPAFEAPAIGIQADRFWLQARSEIRVYERADTTGSPAGGGGGGGTQVRGGIGAQLGNFSSGTVADVSALNSDGIIP